VRVRWLRAAVTHLITETEYIARDNPAAAARVETDIRRGLERLRRFPSLGRPGRVLGTRELVIPGTAYITPYRVRHDTVEILRVFRATRRWPEKS
jgi:plasmid stabilization system protein ParE